MICRFKIVFLKWNGYNKAVDRRKVNMTSLLIIKEPLFKAAMSEVTKKQIEKGAYHNV